MGATAVRVIFFLPFLQNSKSNADKERDLDKRIDRIKQKNKALERREKEIEKDKQLYG